MNSYEQALINALVRRKDPLAAMHSDGIIYRFVNVYRLAGTKSLVQMGEVKDSLREAKIAGYKCHGVSGYSTLRLWIKDGEVVDSDVVHVYNRPKGK